MVVAVKIWRNKVEKNDGNRKNREKTNIHTKKKEWKNLGKTTYTSIQDFLLGAFGIAEDNLDDMAIKLEHKKRKKREKCIKITLVES